MSRAGNLLRRVRRRLASTPPATPAASFVRRPDGTAPEVSAESVRAYYEEMTPAYLRGFGEVFQGSRPESTAELLAYIADALDLSPGMRLLDAGCGVGGPALHLARHRDVTIEGVTLAAIQAERAATSAREAGLSDRLAVRQGDFHELASLYPAASFDRVMFLESLCHARDMRQVLAGARALLRPGGGLYIKDFYALDHSRDPARAAAQARDLAALNALYRLCLPRLADLVALVEQLGFLVRYARMPEYASTYSHWAAYEHEAGRFWAPASGAPGEVIQGIEIFAWKTGE